MITFLPVSYITGNMIECCVLKPLFFMAKIYEFITNKYVINLRHTSTNVHNIMKDN